MKSCTRRSEAGESPPRRWDFLAGDEGNSSHLRNLRTCCSWKSARAIINPLMAGRSRVEHAIRAAGRPSSLIGRPDSLDPPAGVVGELDPGSLPPG